MIILISTRSFFYFGSRIFFYLPVTAPLQPTKILVPSTRVFNSPESYQVLSSFGSFSFERKKFEIFFENSLTFPKVRDIINERYGGLAQLGERLPYKQRVSGSSPLTSTIYADLAQLVEQLTCNQ